MAHICTVHPLDQAPENAVAHAVRHEYPADDLHAEPRVVFEQTGECCFGCECGWWRHLPEAEDVKLGEDYLSGDA